MAILCIGKLADGITTYLRLSSTRPEGNVIMAYLMRKFGVKTVIISNILVGFVIFIGLGLLVLKISVLAVLIGYIS